MHDHLRLDYHKSSDFNTFESLYSAGMILRIYHLGTTFKMERILLNIILTAQLIQTEPKMNCV